MSKELWVISGRSPVLWTIPFVVTWEGSLAEMDNAVPLMQRQRDAVAARISLNAKRERGKWFMKKADLEAVGHITPGGDPEIYYSWSLPRPDQLEDEEKEKRNEFLDALYMAGVGKTRGELEYYWNQFCRHMLDWLLNKQKPVDLYFMTLHPSAYRANWMHVLSSRYPKLWRAVGNKSANKRELMLLESGFMDELLSLDLLGYNPKKEYCYKRVDIEYGTYWWKNVQAIEKERMARQGVWNYARGIMDGVKRNLQCSLRIYGSYLAQVSRPSVAHVEGESYGDFRFVPNIPKNHKRPSPPKVADVAGDISVKLPAFKAASADVTLSCTHEEMSPVPLVQPAEKDVRDSGGDVSQPPGSAATPEGMHVLPAAEKQVAG